MYKNNMNELEYLTVSDIKVFLNISQAAAYQLVHRNDFPICQIGRSIRIPKHAFLAWVSQHTRIPADLPAAIAS